MKKFTAILLSLVLFFTFIASSNALSIEGGIEPLKSEFIADEGPVVNGYSVDYSYFSPVKENDATKYPLVVWLHG